jgi:hypothetical protein
MIDYLLFKTVTSLKSKYFQVFYINITDYFHIHIFPEIRQLQIYVVEHNKMCFILNKQYFI